ncbi:MAG TPA: AMP-binding protein [Acidimicrobiales bacterium]|nr:AMP-binding protein [Acidimicrobiales bacterium]
MGAINIADAFEAVAAAVPDRAALTLGDRTLSFADLEQRSNRLAHWLLAQGVQQGEHVGLYLQNCFEYIEGMLAAWKIRAVPINVNFRYVADELCYLFKDAELVGVIHQPEYVERVAEITPAAPALRWSLQTGAAYETALTSSSPTRDFPPRSGDDLYVLYTGGTTGMPKGVVWRHDDAFFACMGGGDHTAPEIQSVDELVTRINPKPSTFLLLAPLMHAAGGWTVMIQLLQGNRTVLWVGPLDGDAVWELIAKEGVNSTSVVGDAVMRPLLDAWDAKDPKPDVRCIGRFSSGGAPLSAALRERFLRTFPGVPLGDGYGSSETGFQAGRTFVGPTGDRPEPQFGTGNTVVLDEDTHEPVPPGSDGVGRIARTGRIPLAYYNDPEKTVETFVVWNGKRWALTGDMAMVNPDGSVKLLGRGSVCINTGGEKVFAEEVEAVLRYDDSVNDVVVVGVPDERWGQRVVAVVEAKPGMSGRDHELRDLARRALAGYKVPKQIVYVDHIVRSPSGKADYRWAAEVAAARAVL